MSKLTNEEYKQLVMSIAIEISPKLIEIKKEGSDIAATHIALYARDIADAVDSILRENSSNS